MRHEVSAAVAAFFRLDGASSTAHCLTHALRRGLHSSAASRLFDDAWHAPGLTLVFGQLLWPTLGKSA